MFLFRLIKKKKERGQGKGINGAWKSWAWRSCVSRLREEEKAGAAALWEERGRDTYYLLPCFFKFFSFLFYIWHDGANGRRPFTLFNYETIFFCLFLPVCDFVFCCKQTLNVYSHPLYSNICLCTCIFMLNLAPLIDVAIVCNHCCFRPVLVVFVLSRSSFSPFLGAEPLCNVYYTFILFTSC